MDVGGAVVADDGDGSYRVGVGSCKAQASKLVGHWKLRCVP